MNLNLIWLVVCGGLFVSTAYYRNEVNVAEKSFAEYKQQIAENTLKAENIQRTLEQNMSVHNARYDEMMVLISFLIVSKIDIGSSIYSRLSKKEQENIDERRIKQTTRRRNNVEVERERDNKRYERDREKRIALATEHSHRRKARKLNTVVEKGISILSLKKKHGTKCYYCGKEMDFKKGVGRKFKNDMATIEHLIPLARGGEHTFENTVLACRFCNISRGAKSQEEFEKYVENACTGFEKTLYQHFVQHYLSRRSPYKSLLLFHGLGSGKTCSAITIAESLLLDHSQKEEPKILVISPSALQTSFEEQIFAYSRFLDYGDEALQNQCTEDTYRKLIYGTKDKLVIKKRIQQLIHSRYQFITYDGLVTYLKNRNNEPVRDKVIIVDEAHNLRQNEVEKAAAEALVNLVENGQRNRLVLLSATPMYNEPNEIFWLLSLLIKNDKRTNILANIQNQKLFKINSIQDEKTFELLKLLSNEYISYIKGSNPFTFPVRLSPSINGVSILNEDWTKNIKDGLIVTPLGSDQKGILHENEQEGKVIKNSPVLLQLTNITYPINEHGEEGFKKVFRRLESDYLKKKGINFFTPNNLNLQCGYMKHTKNYFIKPHQHQKRENKIFYKSWFN